MVPSKYAAVMLSRSVVEQISFVICVQLQSPGGYKLVEATFCFVIGYAEFSGDAFSGEMLDTESVNQIKDMLFECLAIHAMLRKVHVRTL